MSSKRKACIKAVVTTIVIATVALGGAEVVDADTSAKTTQGVVLKTSQLKVDKVIVSPTVTEEKGKSASNNGNTQLSRGTNSAANDIISYAYNFIGTPYVFGSNGPGAFDCSAFTKYVFAHFGIGLPRTSQSQYNAGKCISRENLQTGDLVFFNTYTYLGHVGIYIGGGDFIHASSSKGVTVSSLNDGYYNSRFQGGARVR